MYERLRGKPWQYLAAWSGGLTLFSAGTIYAWINPVLHLLESPQTPVILSSTEISLVASLPELGSMITALPAGLLADNVGRKVLLLVATPLTLVSWLIIIFSHNIILLMSSRLLQGLSVGLTSTVFPMYLSEIAEPSVRGRLGNIFIVAFCLGQIYEFAIGPFVSYELLGWLNIVPNVVLLLTFVWFQETPYYLLMKGKTEKARQSLESFRKNESGEEFRTIQRSMIQEMERKETWKSLFTTKVGRKGLLVTSTVAVTTFMSGIMAVMSYSSKIFFRISGDHFAAQMFTLGMGIIFYFGALIASFMLDKWGRKPTLIVAHIGNLFCSLIPSIFYVIHRHGPNIQSYWYIPVSFIVLGCLFSMLAVCAIKVYQSELFSTATRGLATGINTLICGAVGTATIFMFTGFDELGIVYVNFIIFTLCSLFGGIFIFLYAPETNGKTFDEIQTLLHRETEINQQT